jgi:hypothetical protein
MKVTLPSPKVISSADAILHLTKTIGNGSTFSPQAMMIPFSKFKPKLIWMRHPRRLEDVTGTIFGEDTVRLPYPEFNED